MIYNFGVRAADANGRVLYESDVTIQGKPYAKAPGEAIAFAIRQMVIFGCSDRGDFTRVRQWVLTQRWVGGVDERILREKGEQP